METIGTFMVIAVMYLILAGAALVFIYGASKVSGNFEGDNAEE